MIYLEIFRAGHNASYLAIDNENYLVRVVGTTNKKIIIQIIKCNSGNFETRGNFESVNFLSFLPAYIKPETVNF